MHTEFRPETYARLTAANAELTKTGIMLSRKATQRPWLVFTMGRHPITGKNAFSWGGMDIITQETS